MMEKPVGYCFCVVGRRMGPWRPTAADAREDALEAGYGSRDEFSATIYLDVTAEIWVTFDETVTVEARPPAPPIAIGVAEQPDAYPHRIDRIIARREAQEGREAA